MKASRFEYRFRYLLHAVIYGLGFWAPWNGWLHLDPAGANAHTWGLLAVNLMQVGVSISLAFQLLLWAAILCAFAGVALRTWGGAYLGAAVVQAQGMYTAEATTGLLQDGPFRYVRNPLYLGTFLHTLAVSLLMPRSGAILTLVLIGVLQIRLILAEEPFLTARLGAPYLVYCGLVPRLFPALRPRVASRGAVPHWTQAALGESYMWGVALAFAAAGWHYNAMLLLRCLLVSLGISLLIRAFLPTMRRA